MPLQPKSDFSGVLDAHTIRRHAADPKFRRALPGRDAVFRLFDASRTAAAPALVDLLSSLTPDETESLTRLGFTKIRGVRRKAVVNCLTTLDTVKTCLVVPGQCQLAIAREGDHVYLTSIG